jgi:hypothetical protein
MLQGLPHKRELPNFLRCNTQYTFVMYSIQVNHILYFVPVEQEGFRLFHLKVYVILGALKYCFHIILQRDI